MNNLSDIIIKPEKQIDLDCELVLKRREFHFDVEVSTYEKGMIVAKKEGKLE